MTAAPIPGTARACAVAEEIFLRFPGYVWGLVLARGVQNGPSSPELVALLRSHCGGRVRLDCLEPDQPKASMEA